MYEYSGQNDNDEARTGCARSESGSAVKAAALEALRWRQKLESSNPVAVFPKFVSALLLVFLENDEKDVEQLKKTLKKSCLMVANLKESFKLWAQERERCIKIQGALCCLLPAGC
ncbi:hypothetical protein RB195_019089 [Necator americanus]|uniref:Uncharacterized protein n=1 Tax=Necator americanus TaxID=51031 RepID=A0ABR1CF83_NECAM